MRSYRGVVPTELSPQQTVSLKVGYMMELCWELGKKFLFSLNVFKAFYLTYLKYLSNFKVQLKCFLYIIKSRNSRISIIAFVDN